MTQRERMAIANMIQINWTRWCKARGMVAVVTDGIAVHISDYADGWDVYAADPERGVFWHAFVPTCKALDVPTEFCPVPVGEMSQSAISLYREEARRP